MLLQAFSSEVPEGPGQNPTAAMGRNLGTPRLHIHLLPKESPAQHGDRPLVHVVNGMPESHKIRASRESSPLHVTCTLIPSSGICSAPSLVPAPALSEVAAHAVAPQSHQKLPGGDREAAALIPPPLPLLLLLQMVKQDQESRPS